VEEAGWAAVGAASSGGSMVVRAGGALQHSHGGWTYVETHSVGGVWLPIEETRERWMREMSWTVGASMRSSTQFPRPHCQLDEFYQTIFPVDGFDALNTGGLRYAKQKIVALKPRSSLQGGDNESHISLIELAEEFVDDEVDEVTSRFLPLILVSREKMCSPFTSPTI
jgi:hypothetical protein